MPLVPPKILACLKPPGGRDDHNLVVRDGGLACPETGAVYSAEGGILRLFREGGREGRGVGERVRAFYEAHPFPSYEGLEEFGQLVAKGQRNPFSANLLKAVGHNKLVLECGCGTGQLSHFLQLNNNHVLGVDASVPSLGLAVEHKSRNGLQRSCFAEMNVFELAVKDGAFDVVVAHGVLHHTYDARRAFAGIVRKAKPGGIVMVGLYNRYARVPQWLRAGVVRLFGPRVDYVVRNRIKDARKAEIWIRDQYFNPHETWHSIGEVLEWFRENGVTYLNASPPILGTAGEDAPSLFAETDPGTPYQRLVTQLAWLATIAREGALFDVVGRRDG
jgi:SAM-dependent methyltransferase